MIIEIEWYYILTYVVLQIIAIAILIYIERKEHDY